MHFRKAQVQAITMVLMAGIVISLVGAAWFWGKPVIDKRTTLTEVSVVEAFMIELDKQIIEVARTGGTKSLRIPSLSGSNLKVNATKMPEYGNELVYQYTADQAMIDLSDGTASIPVETYDDNPVGPYGGSPRIMTLEGEALANNQYAMRLRLRYRQLEDTVSKRGYRILLNNGGRVTNARANQITVKFLNTTTASGECCKDDPDSGDVLQTWLNVSIS